jgi:hypothetical protein
VCVELNQAPKDLIQRLETADIERAGKALAAEHGLQWRPEGQLKGRSGGGSSATMSDGRRLPAMQEIPIL